MTPEQWKEARELFASTRILLKENHEDYLQKNCTDPAVLEQVKKLLQHDREDDFLDEPALGDSFTLADSQKPESGMTLPENLIEGYKVTQILGSGASGIVYEAQQHDPKRMVAIKVLRAGAMGTDEQLRFRREAETLAELNHPNIATVFATGTTNDGSPWMSMELVSGARLDHWCTHADEFSIAAIMKVIGEAVQQAHMRHIIHRDLKPANILVTDKGEPRVLDFGVARITRCGDSTIVTQTGAIIGTKRYMSPEQASGGPNVDARSDVYALGVMLNELLKSKQIRDLLTIARKASDEFPDRRYKNAGEFSEDLQRWIDKKPIKARRATPAYTVSLWVRRHRIITALLCIIAISTVITVNQTQKKSWMQYASLIQQSQLAYENGDLAQMSSSLSQCDPNLRNWEWRWLQQRSTMGEIPVNTLSVASDPNGQIIASLPSGEVVEIQSGTVLLQLSPPPLKTLISKDGSTLITLMNDGSLSVYSILEQRSSPINIGTNTTASNISAMAISDDGRYLVLAITPPLNPQDLSTLDANTQIVGFDTALNTLFLDDRLLGRILDTNAAVDVSTNGTTIVSSIFGSVSIWRFGDVTDRRTIKLTTPSTVAVDNTGSMVAIASLGSGASDIKLLDIETLLPVENIPPIKHGRGIISVDFSPDTTKLASIDSNGILKISSLQGEDTLVDLTIEKEQDAIVQFSGNSKIVLIMQGDGVTSSRSATKLVREYQVWNSSVIKKAYPCEGGILAHLVNGRSMYNFENRTIRAIEDNEVVQVPPPTTPDGKRTAVVTDGGTIRVVDTRSNTPLISISWSHTQIVGAGFANQGQTLVAVSLDGRVRTWDASY